MEDSADRLNAYRRQEIDGQGHQPLRLVRLGRHHYAGNRFWRYGETRKIHGKHAPIPALLRFKCSLVPRLRGKEPFRGGMI